MSLTRLQNLGYTIKHNIDSGRAIFLNYAQQKKMIELGRLLRYNLFSPDNNASIITQMDEGAAHTTPEELERYIAELLTQLDLVELIPKKPNAPQIVFGEGGSREITIHFNPGKPTPDPISNYVYSTDNGVTYRPLFPEDMISPITITSTSSSPFGPLVNGTTYTVKIAGINFLGIGEPSNEVNVTPAAAPEPPINLTAVAGNQTINIYFDPGDNGGAEIVNYLYSTDGGTTFRELDPPIPTSPVTITTLSPDGTTLLDNGTEYTIKLKAKTINNSLSAASEPIPATPASVPEPPTITYAFSQDGQIIITIVFGDDGGAPITEYAYSTDDGSTFVSLPL
jgi:hypothetical protein